MSEQTNIGWCDSTVNPTSGCDGCEILRTCYARLVHEQRLALSPSTRANYAADFLEVRMIPGRMAKAARWKSLAGTLRPDKPWLDGSPRHIFISDMSDALSEAVPFKFLQDEIIANVESAAGLRHVWLWLTKRPDRMAEFAKWNGSWPSNLWAGTSVTGGMASQGRIEDLLEVPAGVRFVSYEPALAPMDFSHHLGEWCKNACCAWKVPKSIHSPICVHSLPMVRQPGISWLIIGGESGPAHREMDLGWMRNAAIQCKAAGVPVFIKQDSAAQSGQRGSIPADLWALKESPS